MLAWGPLIALLLAAACLLVVLWRRPWKRSRSRRHSGGGATPVSAPTSTVPAASPLAPAIVSGESASIPEVLTTLSVLATDDLDHEAQETLQRLCDAMGEPHPVQQRLALGLDEPEDLIEVVSSDAGLSAEVLRIVNSAAFSLVSPITSVPQAVNYLGVTIVQGVVLRATLRPTQASSNPALDSAMLRVWQSACYAAAMARLLALELGIARPSILGTQALLMNIGDVALLRNTPEAPAWYGKGSTLVERISRQQNHHGLHAAILGAALVEHWGLPVDIARAIASSYLPLVTGPGGYPLRDAARDENILLYLAARIGDQMAFHELRDIGRLDLDPGEDPDLFWLDAHLHAARLGRVTELMQQTEFRRKANRVLDAFAHR